ncbi:MAG: transposase [Bryobacteraceae bacterium]|nr:transposase [Bryobacteraceae bacterium]
MPRKARFAPPGYWMHIVQRGHQQQPIFRHDDDRLAYLNLLSSYARDRQVQILGYTLMPDHVHLVALGKYPHAIAEWMRCLNGHYGQRLQGKLGHAGRFWQERFFSCTVDERHLRSVLRYVEQNPVRAGLLADAVQYPWSSAAAHTGPLRCPGLLNHDEFARRFTPSEWRLALMYPQAKHEVEAIQQATRSGMPLGTPEFLAHLEAEFDVVLPRQPSPARARAASA